MEQNQGQRSTGKPCASWVNEKAEYEEQKWVQKKKTYQIHKQTNGRVSGKTLYVLQGKDEVESLQDCDDSSKL